MAELEPQRAGSGGAARWASLPRAHAVLWLVFPWVAFVLSGMMAPYDRPWQLASLPVLMVAGFALLAIPALVVVLFVRTRLLFFLSLVVLSVAGPLGVVTMARSDDAQAGLALLWTPYVGTVAAIVLAVLDILRRRRGNRSPVGGLGSLP